VSVYVISYDLRKPGRNYSKLFDAIRSVGGWCHALESFWLVKSNLRSDQLRQRLLPHIDNNDGLVVVEASSSWTSFGVSEQVASWLKANLG
jgi:hypothetical protein